MESIRVCKDISWDGQSFFCERCGKAGYRTELAARGHLGSCKGRAVERGIPASALGGFAAAGGGAYGAQEVPRAAAAGGGGAAAQKRVVSFPSTGRQVEFSAPSYSSYPAELPPQSYPQSYPQSSELMGLNARVQTLENELNHQLTLRNRPTGGNLGGWIQENLPIVIILGVVVFIMLYSNSRGSCSVEGTSQRRGLDVGKIGERMLNKGADTIISKGLGRIFR